MRNSSRSGFLVLLLFSFCLVGSSFHKTMAQVPHSAAPKASQVDRQVTLPAAQIDKADVRIAAPAVTATLPASKQAVAARIDATTLSLKNERVVLQDTDKLSDLLEASGIKPDVAALSLIYDLNPTIDDLNSLRAGTPLILPRIEGDIFTQIAVTEGYRIGLVSDAAAIQQINTRGTALADVSARFATVEATRFANPKDKEAINKALEIARNALRIMGAKRFPISRKVLLQSSAEAENLRTTVQRAVNSREVNSEVRESIEKTSAALKARSDNIASGGSGQVTIEVSAIRRDNGNPVPLLRVFYAPELDPTAVDVYPNPTSPTSKPLPLEGTFNLWAAESDDPAHPLSDIVPITVHSTNPTVTLIIK